MRRDSTIIIKLLPHEIKKLNINIHDSWSYAKLIMTISRLILNRIDDALEKEPEQEYIKLCSYKFIRCFVYISRSKYISFAFPFRFGNNCFWYHSYKVDSKLISDISSIIESRNGDTPLHLLYQDNGQDDTAIQDIAYEILENILFSEPGYVRHDKDERAARGIKHPESHLDINLSAPATFKIGTYNMLIHKKYESIFDKTGDCMFLEDYKITNTIKRQHKPKRSKHKRK